MYIYIVSTFFVQVIFYLFVVINLREKTQIKLYHS